MKLSTKLMTSAVMLAAAQLATASDWGVYGGDTGNTRYSSAKQINTSNVSNLQVKWALQLGSNRSQESTPILVGDTPDQFAAYIASEIEKWRKVVIAAGVKPGQ